MAKGVKNARVAARRASAATVIQRSHRQKKIDNLRLNPTVAKLVDRRINKKEETKVAIFNTGNTWHDQNGPIDAGDLIRLMPSINQGDTRQDRAGSKIRLVSMTIKGLMHHIPPEDEGQNDNFLARLMVISSKNDLDDTTGMAAKLLRYGNDVTNYNGTLQHHYYPVNYSSITHHYDRSFIIKSNRYYQVDNTNSNPSAYGVTRPIVVRPFFIKLKVRNKILRYGEAATLPENFDPYICLGLCNLNNDPGTAMNSAGHCKYAYQVTVKFKDM